MFARAAAGKTRLRTDGHGRFLVPESMGPGHFEPATGEVLRFVTQGEGEPPEIWDRLSPYLLSAGARRELVASYYSDELVTGARVQNLKFVRRKSSL